MSHTKDESWISHNVPSTRCPVCGCAFDAATNTQSPRPPVPGDPSVCIECASALVFAEDLTLRVALAKDIDAWPPDLRQQIIKVQLAIQLRPRSEQP